jgi:uncharacterized membrane protein YvlD (DUF360 family)
MIREFILRVIVNAVGLYAISGFLPKEVQLGGLGSAAFVVAVWCVATSLLRPILFAVKLVTTPLNWITLGLYGLLLGFLVNMLVLVAIGLSGAVEGFQVPNFVSAIKVSLLFSLVNGATTMLIGSKKENR